MKTTRTTGYSRRRVALASAAALAVLAGVSAQSTASADPAPNVPARTTLTATAIPSSFVIDTMSLGRHDDPNLGEFRPVAMTQLLLRRWSSTLVVDGSFGYKTKAAVESFQRAEGLPVTGKLTRADFYRLFVRQTVRYGSTGDSVRAIQMSLARDPLSNVRVDGSFGAITYREVQREQDIHGRCHGLTVDGIVGPLTRAMAYEYEHDSSC